jgi:hypothetical protein
MAVASVEWKSGNFTVTGGYSHVPEVSGIMHDFQHVPARHPVT